MFFTILLQRCLRFKKNILLASMEIDMKIEVDLSIIKIWQLFQQTCTIYLNIWCIEICFNMRETLKKQALKQLQT